MSSIVALNGQCVYRLEESVVIFDPVHPLTTTSHTVVALDNDAGHRAKADRRGRAQLAL